ncbi:hypothetical protein F5Y15DRAFT_404387 [Xylariaceae sp. FL0016]|nr:hypothetical protein F5Y15DRAFT_404387 [Xylariaceae sp. FL0016]
MNNITTTFDAAVAHRLGTCSMRTCDVPVEYAARQIVEYLDTGLRHSLIGFVPGPSLPVLYHDFYVDRELSIYLGVLEHIIRRAVYKGTIAFFESVSGRTICDVFCDSRWATIWEEILEGQGIDHEWVFSEHAKRQMVTGITSACEIDPVDSMAQTQEMRRRQVYAVDQD